MLSPKDVPQLRDEVRSLFDTSNLASVSRNDGPV